MDEPNHAFMLRQAGQFCLVFCGNHRTENEMLQPEMNNVYTPSTSTFFAVDSVSNRPALLLFACVLAYALVCVFLRCQK